MTAAPGMARLVGEGWALGVFQQDGGLVLGIPAESGHRSFGFEFAISARDLAVLESDPYRRKALDFILHETLQPRLTRGDHAGLAPEVQPIIATVLHGTQTQLEQAINAAPNPAYIRHRLREAGFSTPYDKHADGL